MASPRALVMALQHSTAGGAPPHTPAQAIAAALAEHGRRGDTVLAHLNPREVKMLNQKTDGAGVNPATGLLEFNEDGGGDDFGGSSDWGGPGSSGDPFSGGGPDDGSVNSGADPGGGQDDYGGGSTTPIGDGSYASEQQGIAAQSGGNAQNGVQGIANQGGGNFGFDGNENDSGGATSGDTPPAAPGFFDKAGNYIKGQADKALNNPVATALNIAFGQVPVLGQLNSLSGLLGGPTVGGTITAGGRALTGYGTTPAVTDPLAGALDGTGLGLQDTWATPTAAELAGLQSDLNDLSGDYSQGGGVQLASADPNFDPGIASGGGLTSTDNGGTDLNSTDNGGTEAATAPGIGGFSPPIKFRGVQNIPLIQNLQAWR